MEFIQILKQ
ncbi:hypothetical protein DCO56_23590 [Sphingobacterium athyrii]|uniref:Uncharacterized protein n=1 Tax=Sphingobacterium athyrii TaxID=2152717 RepID=A0A363NMV6_9SPHI|nr:hypothetical protein DCO56_23590 [Sphingobacterium athyrii]